MKKFKNSEVPSSGLFAIWKLYFHAVSESEYGLFYFSAHFFSALTDCQWQFVWLKKKILIYN